MLKNLVCATLVVTTLSCGAQVNSTTSTDHPIDSTPGADGAVVKARVLMNVELGRGAPALALTSGMVTSDVVLSASTTMTFDSTEWAAPAVSNAILDFGYLKITDLLDNNLRVCGPSGRAKCSTAVLRIYTTGRAGAGFWNTADNYGAPITASLPGGTAATVGVDAAGAAVVQTLALTNKNVLRFSDFTTAPRYNVKADFSNAGAGTYSATLVLEYALIP